MNLVETDLSDLELRVMAGDPAAMRDAVLYIKHATAFGASLSHHPQEGDTMNPNTLYTDIRRDLELRMHPAQAREAADQAMNAIHRQTNGFRDLERFPPTAYAVPQPAPIPDTPEDAVKRAAAKLADAEAALAAKTAHDARIASIDADDALAKATRTLMSKIKYIVNGGNASDNSTELAQYRKELQPLAEKHGFKIVLVGNKKQACVVEV